MPNRIFQYPIFHGSRQGIAFLPFVSYIRPRQIFEKNRDIFRDKFFFLPRVLSSNLFFQKALGENHSGTSYSVSMQNIVLRSEENRR